MFIFADFSTQESETASDSSTSSLIQDVIEYCQHYEPGAKSCAIQSANQQPTGKSHSSNENSIYTHEGQSSVLVVDLDGNRERLGIPAASAANTPDCGTGASVSTQSTQTTAPIFHTSATQTNSRVYVENDVNTNSILQQTVSDKLPPAPATEQKQNEDRPKVSSIAQEGPQKAQQNHETSPRNQLAVNVAPKPITSSQQNTTPMPESNIFDADILLS